MFHIPTSPPLPKPSIDSPPVTDPPPPSTQTLISLNKRWKIPSSLTVPMTTCDVTPSGFLHVSNHGNAALGAGVGGWEERGLVGCVGRIDRGVWGWSVNDYWVLITKSDLTPVWWMMNVECGLSGVGDLVWRRMGEGGQHMASHTTSHTFTSIEHFPPEGNQFSTFNNFIILDCSQILSTTLFAHNIFVDNTFKNLIFKCIINKKYSEMYWYLCAYNTEVILCPSLIVTNDQIMKLFLFVCLFDVSLSISFLKLKHECREHHSFTPC